MAGLTLSTKTLYGLIIALIAVLVIAIAAVTVLTLVNDNPDMFKPQPTPTPVPTPFPTAVMTPAPDVTQTPAVTQLENGTLGLGKIMNIPGGDFFDAAGNNGSIGGLYESEQYWESTGVTWTTGKTIFGLTELYLTTLPADAPLYTATQETTFTLDVPWRIVWNVTSGEGMSPYSDARLALFTSDNAGHAALVKTFGWNGYYSAETKKVEGFFAPGTYGIGIFLRNAGIDIDIQQSTRKITIDGMEAAE
ncbi:MAG: hypothetical protein Q4Q04_06670 [Methanocorpusculum sp.]|nr:hypothetical protein [Methanocorpusculum sp.]